MSISLFVSKTFWLNMLGIASLAVPGIPLDTVTIGYILAGLNVAARILTVGPVHVLTDAANEP